MNTALRTTATVILVLAISVFGAQLRPAAAAPAPAAAVADWDELTAAAREDGTVQVIVEFDVKTRPEHALSAQQRTSQRKAVRAARASVLNSLPGLPRNLKQADDMALVAFTATEFDLAALRRSPHVRSVVRDRAHQLEEATGDASNTAAGTPSGGSTGEGTAEATVARGAYTSLKRWWDFYRVGAHTAHDNGWTGSGQTVAIIDTGVKRNHPWMDGRVVNEACFSVLSQCPNGSTYQYGYGASAPCTYHWLCRHGTHTGHTAAGKFGVANGSSIIAINVFSRSRGATTPSWNDSDIVWGLRHVYEVRGAYNIAAVNMSLGGALMSGYCDSASGLTQSAGYIAGWINALKQVGIATVVSSGNSNSASRVKFPACISSAISVGNTTLTKSGADAVYGKITGGSNSNTTLDLLAPGTDICSAVPKALETDGVKDGVDCDAIGTSMAAPHVTGALAVMRQYRPYATVDQLLNALYASGPSVYDSRNGISRTRINVWQALWKL